MWNPMNSRIGTRVCSAIAEVLGCFCLYYGTGMMLVIPGYPGEHYLSWGRILYGVVPTILSAGFLALAGWFWSRSGGSASLGTYVKRAFQGALGAVVLFWLGLIVIAHLEGRIP
jgi:hypothetical protein